MAKDQDLPLNPTKISGVCGRLLCCLSYEHEQYVSVKSRMPRKGTWVQTPDGPGEVVGGNVLRETVIVALASTGIQEEFSPTQIQEAIRQVGEIARSRNAEGITPAARLNRERRAEQERRGEKRLLRDSIDNPDVLEALAWLEEGAGDPPLELLEEEDLDMLSDDLPIVPQPSKRSAAPPSPKKSAGHHHDSGARTDERTPSAPDTASQSSTSQRQRRRRRPRNS
jgi:hypothetical protein